MVGAEYTIYLRNEAGRRDKQVEHFTALKIERRWGEPGKWSVESEGLSRIPFHVGQGIAIYRSGSLFFSGFVETIEEVCDEAQSGIISWIAEGRETSVLLERRLVLPDPVSIQFNDALMDALTDNQTGAIMRFVNRNGGEAAANGRRIMNLQVTEQAAASDGQLWAYRLKRLDEVCKDIGAGEITPAIVWEAETGRMELQALHRRELSDEVIFAVEYGTVLRWSRKSRLPRMNAVWAAGAGEGKNRIIVFAKSEESIARFGRFEGFLSDSAQVQEATADKPAVTEADAVNILLRKAESALQENAASDVYSVEVREGPRAIFNTDWNCGDRVTCIVDGERIISTIDSVSIEYTADGEHVQAAIGEVRKGIFSALFEKLVEIQKGLETEERA